MPGGYTWHVSDTIRGVKVLSTEQALKFLLSVTPLSGGLVPLAKLPSFPKGSSTPTLPLASGLGLGAGAGNEDKRAGGEKWLCDPPLQPPRPRLRSVWFSRPTPRAAFLPSPLSRSLRALSPLSASFTAQSVIN